MKQTLRVIKNELRSEKRVLPEQKPKPLNPPKFDESPEHRIDFWNPNLKWLFGITQYFGR